MTESLPRLDGASSSRSTSVELAALRAEVARRGARVMRRSEVGGAARPALMVAVGAVVAVVLGLVMASPASSALVSAGRTTLVPAGAAAGKADGAVLRPRTTTRAIARSTTATTATTASASTAAATTTVPSGAPVPATPTEKARNVPSDPPVGSGHGRRIVYSKALMTVWIVGSAGRTVRRYPVVGRWDRPAKGTYHVYSMSGESMNAHSKVTFRYMVRFAWGTAAEVSIGFHTIPVYYAAHEGHAAGTRMHGVDQLGLPIAAGGCVRQSDADARFLYDWVRLGDTVVVLPSP